MAPTIKIMITTHAIDAPMASHDALRTARPPGWRRLQIPSTRPGTTRGISPAVTTVRAGHRPCMAAAAVPATPTLAGGALTGGLGPPGPGHGPVSQGGGALADTSGVSPAHGGAPAAAILAP